MIYIIWDLILELLFGKKDENVCTQFGLPETEAENRKKEKNEHNS